MFDDSHTTRLYSSLLDQAFVSASKQDERVILKAWELWVGVCPIHWLNTWLRIPSCLASRLRPLQPLWLKLSDWFVLISERLLDDSIIIRALGWSEALILPRLRPIAHTLHSKEHSTDEGSRRQVSISANPRLIHIHTKTTVSNDTQNRHLNCLRRCIMGKY